VCKHLGAFHWLVTIFAIRINQIPIKMTTVGAHLVSHSSLAEESRDCRTALKLLSHRRVDRSLFQPVTSHVRHGRDHGGRARVDGA
jgi:hypothetical protein